MNGLIVLMNNLKRRGFKYGLQCISETMGYHNGNINSLKGFCLFSICILKVKITISMIKNKFYLERPMVYIVSQKYHFKVITMFLSETPPFDLLVIFFHITNPI